MTYLRRLGASVAMLCLTAAASPVSDYTAAKAALTDLNAAIGVITTAENSFDTDPAIYRKAAQKAINVLVGARDPLFAASAGQPEDAAGAIGRIDALLDRTASPVWAAALQTAQVNERAAVGRLQAAGTAHELADFQTAASQALTNLEVALGRPNDAGVFGGLQGAFATTELGVPDGASRVDACAAPTPGWGVHDGALGFVALDPNAALPSLADPLGVVGFARRDGVIVLQTAAWPAVALGCGAKAVALAPPAPVPTTPGPATPAPATPAPADKADALPMLYTPAQAKAGEAVYAANCVSCHGTNMQGLAAPAIAGTDFLTAAKDNEWSLQQIRAIVTELMPLNAGGSLPPKQYAEVMAYLLASNCFPAGDSQFPENDRPDFAEVSFAPPATPVARQNEFGACPVR